MKSILKMFSEHGTFIQPDALNYISLKENPGEFANVLIKNLKEYPLVLTLENIKNMEQSDNQCDCKIDINQVEKKKIQSKILSQIYDSNLKIDHLDEENDTDLESDDETLSFEPETKEKEIPKPIKIKAVKGWKPLSKEYESEIKIIKDVTGKSTSEGTTQDFVKLFRNRFDILKRIIRNQRREIANILPINRIKRTMSDVQLIGIVKNVKTTLNGHKLIEIEDDTGSAVVMALKNKNDVFCLACEVIVDEVIGVVGKLSKNGDLIIAQNIVFPDIKLQQEIHRAEEPICAAFLSDIHIGSNMFLRDEWNSFLKWINGNLGNSRQKNVASKIKYLVLPGDLVDGIGIYRKVLSG